MPSVIVNKKMLRDDRLLVLMESSGKGRAELVGILALFWMKTRAEGLESIHNRDNNISHYLPVPPEGAYTLMSQLHHSGYLRPVDKQPHVYTIVDNEGLAQKKARLMAKVRKAGQASGKKRTQKKKAELSVQEPSVNAQAWFAYAKAYRLRYHHEPVRNAKTNSLISLFTKRIPQAEAASVLAFYVQHNDMRYVHKLHPLDFALKDAEALYTQYKSGHVVTYAEAKAAERIANPHLPNERTLEVRGQLEAIRRGEI